MKVIVNRCYGGFGLSTKAIRRYLELKGLPCYFYKQSKYNFKDGVNEYSILNNDEDGGLFTCTFTKYFGKAIDIDKISNEDYKKYSFHSDDIKRNNPILIQVVEELGSEASGECANLQIIEIPDDVDFKIEEYDGSEWVSEKHRTW